MNAQMLTQDDPHAGSTHDSPVVLIADSFNEAGVDAIRSLGCNVHCDASLDGESLIEAVNQHQPNAIIVRSTKVPQPVFEVADHLSLVIRAGRRLRHHRCRRRLITWHLGGQLPRYECHCCC